MTDLLQSLSITSIAIAAVLQARTISYLRGRIEQLERDR